MKSSQQKPVLVSSCLLGLDTRYNGVCKKNQAVVDTLAAGNWSIIPICPEQLAGLPTPRPATQFTKGDGESVLNGTGTVRNQRDVEMNHLLLKGAEQSLAIARLNRCTLAILKERSPSCGVREVYRNGSVVPGRGVTSAMLLRHGLSIFNEDSLSEFIGTAVNDEE